MLTSGIMGGDGVHITIIFRVSFNVVICNSTLVSGISARHKPVNDAILVKHMAACRVGTPADNIRDIVRLQANTA
jgi:hypothetical protein